VTRDNEYIRQILAEMVNSTSASTEEYSFFSPTEEEKKRAYHVSLLIDAGYLTVSDEQLFTFDNVLPWESGRAYSRCRILRVTNLGQDFASAISNDTIWKKTQVGVAAIGGATLGIVKDIAVAYIKQTAAEKLGIKLP
jgi:hypothetical protein